ncbi:MAG: hypothetical protein JWO20_2531 [Candidatus Angelobacter sp.]|nr:hypothetical protein [Candidatus Angelobacter sp.]
MTLSFLLCSCFSARLMAMRLLLALAMSISFCHPERLLSGAKDLAPSNAPSAGRLSGRSEEPYCVIRRDCVLQSTGAQPHDENAACRRELEKVLPRDVDPPKREASRRTGLAQ